MSLLNQEIYVENDAELIQGLLRKQPEEQTRKARAALSANDLVAQQDWTIGGRRFEGNAMFSTLNSR